MTPTEQLVLLAELVCLQNMKSCDNWSRDVYTLWCEHCGAHLSLPKDTTDKEEAALAQFQHGTVADPPFDGPCVVGLAQRISKKRGPV
jgi:hypothetical protein